MTTNILYSAQQKYLESLRRDQEPLIQKMEQFAHENKIPILGRESVEFLEQIISILRPKAILEIGMAIAYSTIRMASKLPDKGKIDSIEISKQNILTARKFISESKLSSKINIIEDDALLIMPKLTQKYDLIFLDADKEDYEKLFYYSILLLQKRGVIVVDNLLWHGYTASRNVPIKYKSSTEHIRKFNKLFISQKGLDTTILPIGDGIGLGVKLD